MRLRTAPHAGLLAIMLLGIARHASAHPVPFSYIDVRIDPDVIHVSVTVHVFDLGHDLAVSPPDRLMDSAVLSEKASAIDALIEQRLHVVVDGRELGVVKSGQIEALVERQSLRLLFDYRPERSPGLVTVRTVMFPYDVTHQTFLNVYDSGSLASQAILDADRSEFEYFAGTLYGAARAGLRFFWRGTLYIFAGPGCWLFLTGLILLGGSTRWIILVVTAFTVADATGLAMARAHMLSPPDRVLEPALALPLPGSSMSPDRWTT